MNRAEEKRSKQLKKAGRHIEKAAKLFVGIDGIIADDMRAEVSRNHSGSSNISLHFTIYSKKDLKWVEKLSSGIDLRIKKHK